MPDEVLEFEYAFTAQEMAALNARTRAYLLRIGGSAVAALALGGLLLTQDLNGLGAFFLVLGLAVSALLGRLALSLRAARRAGGPPGAAGVGPYRTADSGPARVRVRLDGQGVAEQGGGGEWRAPWEDVEVADAHADPVSIQVACGKVRRIVLIPRRVIDPEAHARLVALLDAVRPRFRVQAPTHAAKSSPRRAVALWLALILFCLGAYSLASSPSTRSAPAAPVR